MLGDGGSGAIHPPPLKKPQHFLFAIVLHLLLMVLPWSDAALLRRAFTPRPPAASASDHQIKIKLSFSLQDQYPSGQLHSLLWGWFLYWQLQSLSLSADDKYQKLLLKEFREGRRKPVHLRLHSRNSRLQVSFNMDLPITRVTRISLDCVYQDVRTFEMGAQDFS